MPWDFLLANAHWYPYNIETFCHQFVALLTVHRLQTGDGSGFSVREANIASQLHAAYAIWKILGITALSQGAAP